MKPINKITFVINKRKAGAEELANTLIAKAEKRAIQTLTTKEFPLPQGILADSQCCVVIGGDGTLLSVVEESVRHKLPVIGINLGKLGFMSTFSAQEAEAGFDTLLSGNYQIDERSIINCVTTQKKMFFALNDVVIKNHSSRLVRLEVFTNGESVNEYFCDGLVFSTPTGSTAYNMSAGGPIIHPAAKVLAMTPICPHTLSNRSVIFDHGEILNVKLHADDYDVVLNIDGRSSSKNKEDFPLQISVSDKNFLLMLQKDYSHFKLIRSKLNWTGDSIG